MSATVITSAVETSTADLRGEVADRFARSPVLGCDIETTGLDWARDRIATFQIYSPGELPAIVQVNGKAPKRIAALLENDGIVKIFHHAMFDLRFIARHWNVEPRNVRCTKIAAKLLYPDDRERQTLHALLGEHLGLTLDKAEQTSNWSATQLSQSQLAYAANDVVHLPRLFTVLRDRLIETNLWELASACYAHLSTRVKLEVSGFGDVFTY